MKSLRVLLLVFFSSLLLISVGCQSVPATGAAGDNPDAMFRFGELVVVQENSFEDVYEATLAAIEEEELYVTDHTKNPSEAVIGARDRADHRITIKLKDVRPQVTSIKIRYGIPGDRRLSQSFFAEIDRKLKERI